MNFLDFVFVVIIGLSVVTGFLAGFAKMGIGIAATIIGVLCGFWFYYIPAEWFDGFLKSAAAANVAGFFVVFGFFVLAGALVGKIVSRLFKIVGLSWVDRLLGAGFGFVRGAMAVAAIVVMLTAFAPDPPPKFLSQSKLMPYATSTAGVFAALAPKDLKRYFHRSVENLEQIWSDGLKRKKQPEKMKEVSS